MVIEINRYLLEGLMTAELKTHYSSALTDVNYGTLKFNRTEIVNAFPDLLEEDAYGLLLSLLRTRFNQRFYWCVRDDQSLWLDIIS